MKIGIFTYRQYPFISANTSIGYIIAEELLKNYQYDIELIGYRQDESQREITQYHNIPITFFNNNVYKQSYLNNWLKNNILKLGYYNYCKEFRRSIEKKNIDLLITVFNPIDTVFISEVVRKKIPIIYYQLDPFYQYNIGENTKLKKYFIQLLKSGNYLLTTEELYSIYLKDPLIIPYKCHIIPLRFPKLIHAKIETIDTKYISYIGTLYKKIRPASILSSFAQQVPNDYKVIFMGNSDCEINNQNLECLGQCSQEDARRLMSKSGYLINIGNNTLLQSASKLIDYISTGHPIINIYQRNDCPTLKLLESYPYKMNIKMDDLINGDKQKNMRLIHDFLNNTSGKIIPFSVIKKLYPQFTPDYVTEQVVQVINKINIDLV